MLSRPKQEAGRYGVPVISEWIEALSNRFSRNCGAASIMKDSGTPKSQVLDFNINKIRRYVIDRLGYQHVPIPGDKRRRGFTHFLCSLARVL